MELTCGRLVRLTIAVIAPLLSAQGCAGSSYPSLPGQATVANSPRNISAGSWMTRSARAATLIYALDERTGYANVYDYANGKQVGTITGDFIQGAAGCVDARGNVYLTSENSVVEYAHGGTKPLRTYSPGGDVVGCSIDDEGDLAITSSSPGGVTVYAKGDPKRGAAYSNTRCENQASMGYDNKGDLIGEGQYNTIDLCGVLARAKQETVLSAGGITVNLLNGTMWDGKYIAVSDGRAGDEQTGIYETTLSGSTLTSHGEVLLDDSCYRGYVFVLNPFVVGTKNTPVNDRQGRVVVGANAFCFSSSQGGGIEFWHYPKGGNPFRMYGSSDEITVLAVSIAP